MKSVSAPWCMAGVVAAVWTLPAPSRAQTPPAQAGPYISLGAGVGLPEPLHAEPSVSLDTALRHDGRLDAGFSWQAALGWGFANGLRLEAQGNLTANTAGAVGATGLPQRARRYGGFVNLMYDVGLGLPVVPYVGIGAGGQAIELGGFNRPVFANRGGGHAVAGDAAYQGIVGLSYPLDFVPGLSMTAEYRFVGLFDPQPGFAAARSDSADQVAMGTVRFSGDYDQSVTLGLRFVLFPPEKSPGATVPPVRARARTYLVFFDWDSADLSTRARQIVAEAAQESARVQTTRIEVDGDTDRSGSASYNKALSQRRGESVAAELVRDGVARNGIATNGQGKIEIVLH